jgi:hypothetical protein
MEASMDVREVADLVFENAKQYYLEQGVLPRTCFLLRASGELIALPLDKGRATEGEHCRNSLLQALQESDAVAIFTVRDSRYRCFPHEVPLRPGERGVPEGWIADGSLHDCLNMRIEVRGERAVYVAVPYHRHEDGTITFGEHSEGAEDFIGPAPPSAADEGLRN